MRDAILSPCPTGGSLVVCWWLAVSRFSLGGFLPSPGDLVVVPVPVSVGRFGRRGGPNVVLGYRGRRWRGRHGRGSITVWGSTLACVKPYTVNNTAKDSLKLTVSESLQQRGSGRGL